MFNNNYLVVTAHHWNIQLYDALRASLPGEWHLITDKQDLNIQNIETINPRYIFIPHWHYKIPNEIIENYECVCFHETDVPYGRGGSPIQNLIAAGHEDTVITALRMVEELDAGPVYMKRPLSLHGLAEEIFIRASKIIYEMIHKIVNYEPIPEPQTGDPVVFKRRTPDQSRIAYDVNALDKVFDHIRMLDAEGYPSAFIEHGNFRLEFSRPALKTDRITATVNIKLREDKE